MIGICQEQVRDSEIHKSDGSKSATLLLFALQGLVSRQTEAAVAGGVNVMLAPATTARICLLQALSTVGRCRTFDSDGDGYGRGEGFTVALLRSVLLVTLKTKCLQEERSTAFTVTAAGEKSCSCPIQAAGCTAWHSGIRWISLVQ